MKSLFKSSIVFSFTSDCLIASEELMTKSVLMSLLPLFCILYGRDGFFVSFDALIVQKQKRLDTDLLLSNKRTEAKVLTFTVFCSH